MACAWIVLIFALKIALAADPTELVKGLPGQPQVNFKQYAGQVTINVTADRALFYWFYEADSPNATSLPLVLWLNGGPGCSSVGAGALAELGPFRTNNSGTGLVLNPYSWNRAANMIFLEVPYNVGFSYTNLYSDGGFYTDNQTATDSLLFMLQFFNKFPEYKGNEFYLTGESYAGHYLPTLASHIVAHNNQGGTRINFKGFMVGNPSTDDKYDSPGNLETLYSHSIISDQMYNDAKAYCYGSKRNISDDVSLSKCFAASSQIFKMQDHTNAYNMYDPSCNQILPQVDTVNGMQNGSTDPCIDSVTPYLNLPEVQVALNVKKEPARWRRCNSDISGRSYLPADKERSMLPVYKELFPNGLKIWVYSGDLDTVVSTLSTRSWIRALNLSIEKPWYSWKFKNQVGGWSEAYQGLTFLTVRGSGHMPPSDAPAQALEIFQNFLHSKYLPSWD